MAKSENATIHMYPGEVIPTWNMKHGHPSPEWIFYDANIYLLTEAENKRVIETAPNSLYHVLPSYVRPFHQLEDLPYTHYYSPNLVTSGFMNSCDVPFLVNAQMRQIQEYMRDIENASTTLNHGFLDLIDGQIQSMVVLGDIIDRIRNHFRAYIPN
jgi:hypothetical protein